MPLLNEEDFNVRLQAALSLKREQEARQVKDGVSHLKNKEKGRKKKQEELQQEQKEATSGEDSAMQVDSSTQGAEQVEEQPPVIDPCQCLFDNTIHPTVNANVHYMKQTYGFFVPDAEYVINLKSLIGYCQEKIQIGQLCLFCQRGFRSPLAVKDHMIDARHTKIRYEEGIDLWEFEPFYDFTEANKDFWDTWNRSDKKSSKGRKAVGDEGGEKMETEEALQVVDDKEEDSDSAEWEDMSDDEEAGEDEDDEEYYDEYANNLAQHGFGVTPLGELIFPDGRIVGHRALARYYKQRIAPSIERAAVIAAKRAAGDRFYDARVGGKSDALVARARAAGLDIKKLMNGNVGRSQAGILVPAGGGEKGGFTALSMYRYKAVVKKSRREEARGRRLQQKSTLAINKMDKKSNRLKNNVSVAHAPR